MHAVSNISNQVANVTSVLPLLLAFAMIFVIVVMTRSEHAKLRASRRGLLDQCAHLLTDAVITHGADDFPRLEGRFNGSLVRADLIPDTMTIRRLPQLWLSVAVTSPRPGLKGFAALVRPNGNEFYSLSSHFEDRLDSPSEFPREVLVNGDGAAAQRLLDAVTPTAAAILSDPRVKELAVTAKGVRIVRQAGEGRRGEHLLLRQAVFDGAHVGAQDFASLLTAVTALQRVVPCETEAEAA